MSSVAFFFIYFLISVSLQFTLFGSLVLPSFSSLCLYFLHFLSSSYSFFNSVLPINFLYSFLIYVFHLLLSSFLPSFFLFFCVLISFILLLSLLPLIIYCVFPFTFLLSDIFMFFILSMLIPYFVSFFLFFILPLLKHFLNFFLFLSSALPFVLADLLPSPSTDLKVTRHKFIKLYSCPF